MSESRGGECGSGPARRVGYHAWSAAEGPEVRHPTGTVPGQASAAGSL